MNIIEELEREQAAVIAAVRAVPEFSPGDTLRVSVKVGEGSKEGSKEAPKGKAKAKEKEARGSRTQAYEGVCIARSGSGLNESFTVRKISYGEGVERVFPVYSPMIESITVVRRGAVRRAKLYYLRGLRGKSARIAEKQDRRSNDEVGAPVAAE